MGAKEVTRVKGPKGWIIGLAVIVGAALWMSSNELEPNEYNVQGTCQGIVRNQLKNPTTAEFSSEEQSKSSASGNVTAENALGGKLTYGYRCSRSADTVVLDRMTPR